VVRTGDEELYRYLPIECPKCGLQGKIKISRLDQTFTCKRCKRVFHVNTDGIALGERPPDAPTGLGESLPDKQPWLVRRIEQLPRVGKYLLGGVLLLGALYWLAGWLEPGEPLPGGLEERVELATKSLAYGDWKTLKRLAKSGTATKLGKWYGMARPPEWSGVDKDTPVEFEMGRLKRAMKGSKGGTKAVYFMEAGGVIRPAGKPESKFLLLFSEDKQKEWWLDGEAMLTTVGERRPDAKGAKSQAAQATKSQGAPSK